MWQDVSHCVWETFLQSFCTDQTEGHMGDSAQEPGCIWRSYFAFCLCFYGQLGLLPASLWPAPFSPGCLGRHQRPSWLCYRDSFFRAPGGLAVPPKRKGAKRSCRAWWGALHGPASSWCSFIFPNGADGGCRGEEGAFLLCSNSRDLWSHLQL